jgi:hypothetical protein
VVEAGHARTRPTREALEDQHATVADLAARSTALLPARFGSFVTEAALRALIVNHQPRLVDSLALVRDRRQMTVRVFDEGPAIPPPEAPRSSGTAYLEARRARLRRATAEAEQIRRVVNDLALAERIEPGEHGLRLTVFHLVSNDAVDTYRARTSSLAEQLAPHPVTITGPWPAFAFVPDLF